MGGMHEEMHMTQMQFTNTGAREIVSFLDTTFGQAWHPTYAFKKATRTLRRFAKVRGIKEETHA